MSGNTTSQTKAKPELTPISAFLPGTLWFGGLAQGLHMVKNSVEQGLVLSELWSPLKYTRIGGFAATFKFGPGTVGSGTSASIQLIHSFFGSFGQAQIGNYFNLPIVQQFCSKPIGNVLANTAAASGEYRLWCKVLNLGYTRFLGDLKTFKFNFAALQLIAGGMAGANATVPFRVAIVQGLTSTGGLMRGFQPRSIALCTGAMGSSLVVACVKKLYTFEGPLDAGDDGAARIENID